jgi:hypothetical protein
VHLLYLILKFNLYFGYINNNNLKFIELQSTKKHYEPFSKFRLNLTYKKFQRVSEKVMYPEAGKPKVDLTKSNTLTEALIG